MKMYADPVVYYFEGEEDLDPSFKKFYCSKEFIPDNLSFEKEAVYTHNRTDFLELLAYWNRHTRGWKYIEAF